MSGHLIGYLPALYDGILEMEELLAAEDEQFSQLEPFLPRLVDESTISKADESRISEWEKLLQIVPTGTLAQRRMMVIATLRGQGKLNEQKIKEIVASFTGDENAEVKLENSRLKIRIYPPGNGEIFIFPDVERALSPLIPAHISLKAERWYCTWDDIKTRKADWQTVSADFADWHDIKMWNLEV
jgi:hypothetical protein